MRTPCDGISHRRHIVEGVEIDMKSSVKWHFHAMGRKMLSFQPTGTAFVSGSSCPTLQGGHFTFGVSWHSLPG